MRLINTAATAAGFGSSDDNVALAPGASPAVNTQRLSGAGSGGVTEETDKVMNLDASQRFSYAYGTAPAAGAGLSAFITGYHEER